MSTGSIGSGPSSTQFTSLQTQEAQQTQQSQETQETQETGETESSTDVSQTLPPPSYLALAFARLTVDTLGLDLPNSPGDTTAILAAVEQALDRTIDETRNNRAQQVAGSFRSIVAGMSGFVSTLETKYGQLVELEAQRDQKKEDKAKAESDVATAQQRIDHLQNVDIPAKQQEVNLAQQTVTNLQNDIAALPGQIAAAAAAKNDALVATLTARLSADLAALPGAQSALTARKGELQGLKDQKSQIEQSVSELKTKIETLTREIVSLEAQMTTKTEEYLDTQLQLVNYFSTSATSLRANDDVSGRHDAEHDVGFDQGFDIMTETLEESAELARLRANLQQRLDQLENKEGEERVLDAAGALISGFADLIAILNGLEAPPALHEPGLNQDDGRVKLPLI